MWLFATHVGRKQSFAKIPCKRELSFGCHELLVLSFLVFGEKKNDTSDVFFSKKKFVKVLSVA
jgi:hypothetical protein